MNLQKHQQSLRDAIAPAYQRSANMPTLVATPDRLPRCRYLLTSTRGTNRCTGEVLDADAEIQLCERHAADALAWLRRVGAIQP